MTNALLVCLVLSVAAVAIVLTRGFSLLERRFETASKMSLTPIIGFLECFEDTIVVVNVGGSVAIDIDWAFSGASKSGSIAYLSPQQSSHLLIGTQSEGKLSVTYKSLAGEVFSHSFDVSRIMASENRLALACFDER
jgi:hypothetical protein